VGAVLRPLASITAAAVSVFGVANAHVTVDGSPTFPILAYYQCATTAQQAADAGVDLFVEQPYTACSLLRPNDFDADPPPPGVHALSDDYSAATPDAGWYFPDEPDALGLTASQLPQLPPVETTGKLRVVNVSEHFYSAQALIRAGYDRGEYARFADAGDLLGFDLYPIVKFCGRVPLLDVFRAQRELITTYAPHTPTFQWIETGPMTGECPTIEVTPAIANAEAWLAVAGGAVGIGWFTAGWAPGTLWDRWDIDAAMLAQLQATDTRLHSLAAVLTAPWSEVAFSDAAGVAASSRTYGDARYVIAVNSTAATVTAPLRVPQLGRRTLTVLGEQRTVRSDAHGVFHDRYGPYAVHLYRAGPA
jgi:hypothetical protein